MKLSHTALALCASAMFAACSDDATPVDAGPVETGPRARTNIQHVVIVLQENHSFDNHFGRYCTAAAGSNPTCNDGPACCEAAPERAPSGATPVTLDDAATGGHDPDHSQSCELMEINGGRMDRFVTGVSCAHAGNFALAPASIVGPYHGFAREGALADRYFQSEVGASSANDMYFAAARHVFTDNSVAPMARNADCTDLAPQMRYTGRTLPDLIVDAGFTFSVYIEGYRTALSTLPECGVAPEACPARMPVYPCVYDPADIPFAYYGRFADDARYMRDFSQLATDLQGTLPNVVFVRGLGYHSEHPGYSSRLSDGVNWASAVVNAVRASRYASNTLVLLTWDEGGGYFDHVAPPATNTVDMQPYGTRVPLLAIGRFARRNRVSHVTMEHSSIVKFLEFNFLGATGQLSARDAVVNNIGSLLDPTATGMAVPEN
ncbi:MAG: alkaline phosphatase family protein [Polyangiales bacterium]